MFEGKTVLIISPDSWYNLPVSKHFYAIELAKKNKVFFLNPPSEEQKEDELSGGVNIINHYARFRGVHRLPTVLARMALKIEINKLHKQLGVKNIDVVWSFDTSRLYYLDLFEAHHRVAHLVDYSESFHLKELASTADVCLAISKSVLDRLKQYNSNVHKVNHGFIEKGDLLRPNTFNKKECVYIGNLTIAYLDWEVIYQIASTTSEVNFTFVGSEFGQLEERQKTFFEKTKALSNANFVGRKTPEEVKVILSASDFSLLAYDFEKYPLQLENSHKLMQYLGSGKPIFASYTLEFDGFEDIFMYRDRKNATAAFHEFLEDKRSLFSEESSNKRISFALEHSYSNQLRKVEQIVFTKNA